MSSLHGKVEFYSFLMEKGEKGEFCDLMEICYEVESFCSFLYAQKVTNQSDFPQNNIRS